MNTVIVTDDRTQYCQDIISFHPDPQSQCNQNPNPISSGWYQQMNTKVHIVQQKTYKNQHIFE